MAGLTTPLLEAGARAVATTEWPVGDRATVQLVLDFYDALADGRPAGEALRAAKLATLARGAKSAEWAAFALVGDPLVRIPLRRPRTNAPLWLVLAVAVTAYWFWRVRRHSDEAASWSPGNLTRSHQP